MSDPARDRWLEAHASLRPLADLCEAVASNAAALVRETAPLPEWERYAGDYAEGVPLLRSEAAAVNLTPAGSMAMALVARAAAGAAGESIDEEAAALAEDLASRSDAADAIGDWLRGDGFQPRFPGLLRLLAWAVAARYLAPVIAAFARWRDDERWHRRYCPTCGSGPAMAQLLAVDSARQRLLACGACRTKWRYRRTQCPFCEEDRQSISTLRVGGGGEDEAVLRIDVCEACRGYLKTLEGQGREDLLLADWTSLHLDLLAGDRGLVRRASSLFELPAP